MLNINISKIFEALILTILVSGTGYIIYGIEAIKENTNDLVVRVAVLENRVTNLENSHQK